MYHLCKNLERLLSVMHYVIQDLCRCTPLISTILFLKKNSNPCVFLRSRGIYFNIVYLLIPTIFLCCVHIVLSFVIAVY